MGSIKKVATTTAPRSVIKIAQQMSKAALIDCLLDALGLIRGCKPAALFVDDLVAFTNPRLHARGDRPLTVTDRKWIHTCSHCDATNLDPLSPHSCKVRKK